MATVGETLFIALGLDASSAVEGLKQLQNNLQNISSTAGNSAQKLENDTKKALQNVDIRRQFMTLEMELRSRYKEGLERGEMLGLKKGLLAGKAEGIHTAKLEAAVIAVRKFNLPVEAVAKEYGIAAEMIRKQL